ncbi:MAG TPA: hypothetical protein VNA87_06305 [Actinomycetota bacterium]|nr:hypothetical protein [Actinomycetota bacterium]
MDPEHASALETPLDESQVSDERPKISSSKLPKATKAQMDAVKRSAQEAGEVLDREQEDSVMNLAQALDEINEGEALAHVDTRLSFIERQVERLTARRDEADRGFQGELAIMRARIEDTLEAVGSTAEEQRDSWISLEKRVSGLVADQDSRSTEVLDSLRADLVALVQEATKKLEKTEARVRGEAKALEGNLEERVRSVLEGLGDNRNLVEESLAELDVRLKEAAEAQEARAAQLSEAALEKVAEAHTEIDSAAARLSEQAKQLDARVEVRFTQLGQDLESKIETISGTLGSVRSSNSELKAKIDGYASSLQESLDSERRETDARISESQADLRLETHQLNNRLDEALTRVNDLLELSGKDFIEKIRASEEKSAGAAIHLESLINQVRRQMVSGEQEFSAALTATTEEFSAVRIRLEELTGRVASTEARRTTERGSADVALESIASRMELVETRLREIVEEVVAKHSTRIEVLSSQLANITDTEVQAEERTGAVEYLSRKFAELTERVDEIATRTNILVRSASRGTAGTLPAQEIPTQMDERLKVLETRIAALASAPKQDALPASLIQRLESLERTVSGMASADVQGAEGLEARLASLEAAASTPSRPRPEPMSSDVTGRVDALERTITNIPQTLGARQAEILARLEELERKSTGQPGQTILPDKRSKRRW